MVTENKPAVRVHQSTEVLDPRSTLSLAIEKGLDPETLSKLMDLQERWENNQSKRSFVRAMSSFKREYRYVTTGEIFRSITPLLSKNGFHLSWGTKQEGSSITVTCRISHEKGHWESSTLTGERDESGGKNPIQTVGSSVHLLQRYTMVSVLGLVTSDMDDADQTTPREPPNPSA